MNSNVVQMHDLLSSSRISSGRTEFVYSYFCFHFGLSNLLIENVVFYIARTLKKHVLLCEVAKLSICHPDTLKILVS